jgi:hypothetical protein
MNVRFFAMMLGIASLLCSGLAAGLDAADNWPTWRGPTPNGIAVKGDPPDGMERDRKR